MKPEMRIVVSMPLQELWDESGPISATRVGEISDSEIRDHLGSGQVSFVVADVGLKLVWVSRESAFSFWKTEVLPHIARNDRVRLEDYPGEYCYRAVRWDRKDRGVVILLEKWH